MAAQALSARLKYGRIIRATRWDGHHVSYVVAEEDAANAVAILRARLQREYQLQSIGRASLKLLSILSLSAGEFREAEPEP
jgi:hypothetical protein